jgi:hypothetical protein
MSIRSTLRLLSKSRKNLTEEEVAAVEHFGRRLYIGAVALCVIAVFSSYIGIFLSISAGPSRDLVLDVMNMFTLSLVACWTAGHVFSMAFKAKGRKTIPLTVVATALFVVGASALPDISIRLKGEIGRSLVRSKALGGLSTILADSKKMPDDGFDERLKKLSDEVLEYGRAKSLAVDSFLTDRSDFPKPRS